MSIKRVFILCVFSLFLISSLFAGSSLAGESIEYLEYSDEKVRLDIYDPPGSRKSPVVILIHGSAGIDGDRAVRYRGFARDLMNKGIIAVNVHYFESERENWINTIIETINYVKNICDADTQRIGIVGYSLGGLIGLSVASYDERVKALAMNSGFLPTGFNKELASRLPRTLMISGSEDKAMQTLKQLKQWFEELDKPFEIKINEGYGHSSPMSVFRDNWQTIVKFFCDYL